MPDETNDHQHRPSLLQADENPIGDRRDIEKTPLFAATHAGRYERQRLIKLVQEKTRRRLICFVAGHSADINRDDTLGFRDLLSNIPSGENLDLLLHSCGGDIDAAEKLITMVRSLVGDGHLRVIVPDMAKSAATLMTLCADEILMSDSSELGPIDPQIHLADRDGNQIQHSVLSYLNAFDEHYAAFKNDPENHAARLMLDKMNPATVRLFQSQRDRAKSLAETLLKRGMFRVILGPYTAIAADLMDPIKWLAHSQMIGHATATDIGLSVTHMNGDSEEWTQFWDLYCHQRLAIDNNQKLFESEMVSITLNA